LDIRQPLSVGFSLKHHLIEDNFITKIMFCRSLLDGVSRLTLAGRGSAVEAPKRRFAGEPNLRCLKGRGIALADEVMEVFGTSKAATAMRSAPFAAIRNGD
jgi:hypothetical protein